MGTPKWSILIGFSLIKPSILGYLHLWKPPFFFSMFLRETVHQWFSKSCHAGGPPWQPPLRKDPPDWQCLEGFMAFWDWDGTLKGHKYRKPWFIPGNMITSAALVRNILRGHAWQNVGINVKSLGMAMVIIKNQPAIGGWKTSNRI